MAKKIFMYCIAIIATVTYIPFKILFIFASLSWATLAGKSFNKGTDPTKPLPDKNSKRFFLGNAILGRLLCLGHGLVIVEKNKKLRDKTAHVLAGNHCSYLDAMVMSTIGGGSAIVNQGMADFWFLRSILRVSRAIVVQRPATADDSARTIKRREQTALEFGLKEGRSVTQEMQERVHQMNDGAKWPQLLIFPEGTIANSRTVLKFRTSAFVLEDCRIQPFTLRYRTLVNMEWLTNSGMNAFLRSMLNPFGFIEITYLPVMERGGMDPHEYADAVGSRIAETLGAKYVKYNNNDISYFNGWKPASACTREYLEDFGKLGTFADVKQKLGKKKGYELAQEDVDKLLAQ